MLPVLCPERAQHLAVRVLQRPGPKRRRNADDHVYRDVLLLRREDGELSTVTLDEFTQLKRLDQSG